MERLALIEELRSQRKTYKEIGVVLGVSKQRIHQIFKSYKRTEPSIISKVLQRDEFRCAICELKKNRFFDPHLEVHHIDGVKGNNSQENLITLCRKCHTRLDAKDRRTLPNRKKDLVSRPRRGEITKLKVCLDCKKEFFSYAKKKYCTLKCWRARFDRIFSSEKRTCNKCRESKSRQDFCYPRGMTCRTCHTAWCLKKRYEKHYQ